MVVTTLERECVSKNFTLANNKYGNIGRFIYLHILIVVSVVSKRDEREPEDTVREGTACPVVIARHAAVTQMN